MTDILILVIVIGYCGYLIRCGYKKKKEGKSIGCAGCGGSCASCRNSHPYSSARINGKDRS